MWIPILLYLLLIITECLADPTKECQILQTTDPRTPCYILIRQKGVEIPSFLYMLNIPRVSEELPCPATQTLDPTLTCYQQYDGPNAPAFILNAPLPPNADELDESPTGKLRLRESKANPIFKPITDGERRFQQRTQTTGSYQTSRNLGPPSPYLTTAFFKPLAPSSGFAETPTIRTQPNQDFSLKLSSPQGYHTQYRIFHNYNSPNQRRRPYLSRELASSPVASSYLSKKGSWSVTSLEAPYPPAY